MLSIEYLREFRIGQFAIFDLTTAYLGMLILSPIFTWMMSKLKINVPIVSWVLLTLPLSVVFHIIFQQTTPLIELLSNPDRIQFYVVIFILFAMTYLGLSKIRKTSSS